jgi:hypothetical protein
MGVSGKKQVVFVDRDSYRPSRIRVEGKRGAWFLKESENVNMESRL